MSCPRIPKPEYGTILPANCLLGKIFTGERCLLHCPTGFVAVGKRAAICNADQTWSTNSTLDCTPAKPPLRSEISSSRPFIKCPQDTILILPVGQKTVFIRLEQPKTNVDYIKYGN